MNLNPFYRSEQIFSKLCFRRIFSFKTSCTIITGTHSHQKIKSFWRPSHVSQAPYGVMCCQGWMACTAIIFVFLSTSFGVIIFSIFCAFEIRLRECQLALDCTSWRINPLGRQRRLKATYVQSDSCWRIKRWSQVISRPLQAKIRGSMSGNSSVLIDAKI